MKKRLIVLTALFVSLSFLSAFAGAASADSDKSEKCKDLPAWNTLRNALINVVTPANNSGLGNDMWATLVDRDGNVCSVAFTGNNRSDQWPGSRVISAQKASTANAFSRPRGVIGFAGPLSTANLYSAVQPGGTLFGLQFSNAINTDVAYQGNEKNYGKSNDPLVGQKPAGVNVFGGGLALYTQRAYKI